MIDQTMKFLALLTIILLLFKDTLCIPLTDFYPFGERSERDAFVERNNDGSSELIKLTSKFPFFDENFREIYVRIANVCK